MISFDQVLLLEEKVESAVNKIRQLQAENDALRSKCAELTNALSAKSERLDTFEHDQDKIETGIQNALKRLNAIEDSLLRSTASPLPNTQNNTEKAEQTIQSQPVHNENFQQSTEIRQNVPQEQNYTAGEQTAQNFQQYQTVNQAVSNQEEIYGSEPETQNYEEEYENPEDEMPSEEDYSGQNEFFNEESENQDQDNNGQFDIF